MSDKPTVDTSIASPNRSSRGGRDISMLVIHATAGRYSSDIDILTNDRVPLMKRVSAHYYILKSGRIMQLVPDSDAAWHAGVSSWLGMDSYAIQLASIGIELENLNTGSDPYPDAQMHALIELSRWLIRTYTIDRQLVVRHVDIAPTRKSDPKGFDWSGYLHDVFEDQPDVWDEWGDKAPISEEQKGWGIPQAWYRDQGALGEALTPEQYIPAAGSSGLRYIVQWFRDGIIVGLDKIKNSFTVVRKP